MQQRTFFLPASYLNILTFKTWIILSETKEVHSAHLSEVFQSI